MPLLINGKLTRPESAVAGGYKIATCAGGSVPHLTVVAKELQYRNIKERSYMGHEFTLQVIAKWLISHLSESAKLV